MIRRHASHFSELDELLVILLAKVVEEQPADPACLTTMWEEEILVAPLLEDRVDRSAVLLGRIAEGRVEVYRVGIVQV